MAQPVIQGSPQGWQRVAHRVARRRLDLGLTQVELAAASNGGISVPVIQVVEGARQKNGTMAVRTARALAYALLWHGDSIEMILSGREPIEYGGPSGLATPRFVEVRDRILRLHSSVQRLPAELQIPAVDALETTFDDFSARRKNRLRIAASDGSLDPDPGEERLPEEPD